VEAVLMMKNSVHNSTINMTALPYMGINAFGSGTSLVVVGNVPNLTDSRRIHTILKR
jgi:hypothetical protein